MKVKIEDSLFRPFICGIQENGGIIRWEYERQNKPDMVLIVRTRYGKCPDIELIQDLLSIQNGNLLSDQLIELDNEIACKFIRNIQGMSGVYKVNYTPASYSVYGCKSSNDCISIHLEQNGGHHQCNVSAVIEYKVENVKREITSGWLFNRSRESVSFSKIQIDPIDNYTDGALYYCFEGSDIIFPIGKSMIGKPFYIRWFQNKNHPIIRSRYSGYTAVKRGGITFGAENNMPVLF